MKKEKDKIEKGALKTNSKNQYGDLYEDKIEQKRGSTENEESALIKHAHKISKEKAKAVKQDKNKK